MVRAVLPPFTEFRDAAVAARHKLGKGFDAIWRAREAGWKWTEQMEPKRNGFWIQRGNSALDADVSCLSDDLDLLLKVFNGTWLNTERNTKEEMFCGDVLISNEGTDSLQPYSVLPMMQDWISNIEIVLGVFETLASETPPSSSTTLRLLHWLFGINLHIETSESVHRRAAKINWIHDNYQKVLYFENGS